MDAKTGFDLCGGAYSLIPSSLTEGGSGHQFCGRLSYAQDRRNIYYLSLQTAKENHQGKDFYNDQGHEIYTVSFGRGERSALGVFSKNYYLGLDKVEGVNQLILGTDIASYTLTFKTSGRFGIGLNPYLRTTSGTPLDSQGAEEVSVLNLQAGFALNLSMLDTTTRPPAPGLTDADVGIGIASGAHRLARHDGMAKTLSGPIGNSQNYTEELFGEDVSPSARLEDVGLFNVFSAWGTAGDENLDLELQLQANENQRSWLQGSKVAYTAAYFLLSEKDKSSTMLTQGFTGALGLLDGWIAIEQGLDRPGRQGKTEEAKQKAAADFLYLRSLLHMAGFAAGWALLDEKAGVGILQGFEQASLATAQLPDPAGTGLADSRTSHHLVIEAIKDGGRYLGYQKTAYLPSKHLYTRMRLMGQTVPAPEGVRQDIDEATGRNPLREGAKAKAVASLGGEFEIGAIALGAGVRTLLAYGDGPGPVPGIGAEEQILLSMGENFRVEFGAGASQDYVNGQTQLGISGVAGVRASF